MKKPIDDDCRRALKILAHLRVNAKHCMKEQDKWVKGLDKIKRFEGTISDPDVLRVTSEAREECIECILRYKFHLIEIGKAIVPICNLIDDYDAREEVFEILCVNKADRDTDMVREFGEKTLHLIHVLNLESSATKDEALIHKPLLWCLTQAIMHKMKTDREFDKLVHNATNEFFGNVFGEYGERTITERLIGS